MSEPDLRKIALRKTLDIALDGSEDDLVLHGKVKVITSEDSAAFKKLPVTPDPHAFVSPIDESVLGYSTDRQSTSNGVKEMVQVVSLFTQANIPCCMVAEAALIYYGAARLRTQWIICVPTELLSQATEICSRNESFKRFRPSPLTAPDCMEHLFPRFKVTGVAVFFVLMSSQACHVPCSFENIEYSKNQIPYPKLHILAQSLLDTWNGVDLDDLIDGMDLTLEWGEANLDLDGTIDAEWVRWRALTLLGREATAEDMPLSCSDPPKRRIIWQESVSDQAKRDRQGWKYEARFKTRFRKHSQKDPRLYDRDYC